MMQAARFEGDGRIVIERCAEPVAGPGEVVLRVRACALCGSDLRPWRQGWPGSPGHEIMGVVDAPGHRVYASRIEESARAATNEFNRGFWLNKVFARMMRPALDRLQLKFASGQVYLDQAATACALERCRLANGKYPETLAALSPQFAKSIPTDVFSGEPLKYHRTDDGQYVLYSIGWNEKDDGGVIAMTKERTPHRITTEGDWVWPQYP